MGIGLKNAFKEGMDEARRNAIVNGIISGRYSTPEELSKRFKMSLEDAKKLLDAAKTAHKNSDRGER